MKERRKLEQAHRRLVNRFEQRAMELTKDICGEGRCLGEAHTLVSVGSTPTPASKEEYVDTPKMPVRKGGSSMDKGTDRALPRVPR